MCSQITFPIYLAVGPKGERIKRVKLQSFVCSFDDLPSFLSFFLLEAKDLPVPVKLKGPFGRET